MRMRTVLLLLAGSALAAATAFAQPAPPEFQPGWTQPMTEWGDPDLQGTWPLEHLNGTPLERPEKYGNRRYLTDEEYAERIKSMDALGERYDDEIKSNKMGIGHWAESGQAQRITSLIVDPPNGRLPALTPKGEELSSQMRSSWSNIVFRSLKDFNVLDRCITRGLPASMFPFMYNAGMQIIQSPGYVVIRLEIVHESRIIPLDGRPAPPANVTSYLGASRGHWEGNTLVVTTTNFNGLSPMTIVGPRNKPIPESKSLRITERFTRTGEDTMDYQVTVDDPEILTRPWTAQLPWRRDQNYQLFEYACHEGNHTIRDYISSFRNVTEEDLGK